MKSLICHLGLGDAIVLAGAAVELAERHGGLRFPAYRHNEASVRSFFINYPEIEVIPVANDGDMQMMLQNDPLRCGFFGGSKPIPGEGFDAWFYRQLGVPLEYRWDSCPIREASERIHQTHLSVEPYALMHDDLTRGYMITRSIELPFIRTYRNKNSILRYASMIENAAEVHCINSAFFHLAESLRPRGELFLHRYARPWTPLDIPCTRHHWKHLD